jgi:periplasmic copper chaperone A
VKHLMMAIAMGFGLALSAYAQTQGTIVVEQAWARATPNGAKTGAVYMTLLNKGTTDDRLLGASTPMAEEVQFHAEANENGMMKMRRLASITVSPGAAITLKPGATHAMMIGLKGPLKEGQSFPLTLRFERAGEIRIPVPIGSIGAMSPSGMGGMEMK